MKEISTEEFSNEVLNGGKVVLDFYSTECPPCEALASKFEDLSRLYGNDVKFIKIFRQANRQLAEKLGVKSSPTLLFFDNGSETGERLTGGVKRSEITRNLERLIHADRMAEIRKSIKPSVTEYDVIILGAGPGGLTAGLYLCQSKINTVVVDIALPGGQVSTTHEVSNYPGFIQPQPGYMLSHNMSEQTKQCGAAYKVAVDISKVDLVNKEVIIDEHETIRAKKIIIATGTKPNSTGSSGEKELRGKGISYCATCDAKYFENKEAVIIGGGNSAVEEADFISRFASKITMVHQLEKFTANGKAVDKLLSNPKVSVEYMSEPRSFLRDGDKIITEIEHVVTGERKKIVSDGVFVFIGMKPNIDLFSEKVRLDKWGYIITDEDRQTSLPGVYAVGDVISKKYRQITTAVADGTIAAMAIAKELS
ncbi:MAG TPA: FAD-dependent oxidoreductase [Bacteroidales bacterium]|nr:FAD-dependent oxidoreductase [Bacteroidales bacterium]